ncbi:MAG TPA: hypothetical protein VJ873_11420 [bacterium]|nr:hypothetical protein [bacterium]
MDDHPNSEEIQPRPPLTPAQKKIATVLGVLFLMAGSFYGGRLSMQPKSPAQNPFTQMPPTPMPLGTPVPVTESALTMINFTGASEAKKAEVLAAFNKESCQCNCKMTVAACMIKDPNCPFWKDHVDQFQKALGNGKKPNLPKGFRAKSPAPFAPANGIVLPAPNSNNLVLPPGAGK